MPRSAIDSVAPAFEHVKAQLFRPFRREHWLRLALLGLATGELSGSGGCNSNFGNWNVPSHQTHQDFLSGAAGFLHPPLAPIAIAAIITLAFAFAIAMTYVSSVCRFMLFETVLTRECRLGEQWRRWQEHGMRYFGFQVLMLAIVLGGLAVIVGLPALIAWQAGLFREPRAHVALFIVGGALLATLLLAFFITTTVIIVMTKDFVVPQMALEGVTVTEGWRRLRPRIDSERGSYAGYLGMKIVLTLAAAVALGIATFIFVLVLLIPFIIVAVIVAVVLKPAGLAWTAATIALAVVAGVILFAVIMLGVGFVGSPITVFFPAYSIYFFADRYPPLAARLYPAPPTPPPPPVVLELAPAT